MREQTMKHRVGKQSEAVPWDNNGEQSNPNVRCTLVHVGPTMGGALTLTFLTCALDTFSNQLLFKHSKSLHPAALQLVSLSCIS